MKAIDFRVYADNMAQIKANKSVFKAFKIKFEVEEEKVCDPQFVARVLKAKEEIKQGKGVKTEPKDLWK